MAIGKRQMYSGKTLGEIRQKIATDMEMPIDKIDIIYEVNSMKSWYIPHEDDKKSYSELNLGYARCLTVVVKA